MANEYFHFEIKHIAEMIHGYLLECPPEINVYNIILYFVERLKPEIIG